MATSALNTPIDVAEASNVDSDETDAPLQNNSSGRLKIKQIDDSFHNNQ